MEIKYPKKVATKMKIQVQNVRIGWGRNTQPCGVKYNLQLNHFFLEKSNSEILVHTKIALLILEIFLYKQLAQYGMSFLMYNNRNSEVAKTKHNNKFTASHYDNNYKLHCLPCM